MASVPLVTPDPNVGLTSEEARARLAEYGPNELPRPRGPALWRLALAQVTHLFALLLWTAAACAYLAGMPELALAIVAVVLLNGAFAFLQEYRAERAAERLGSLLPQRITVRRDGQTLLIDARQLVPGDVVVLHSGDRVPADIRLLEVDDFAVDTSAFTGESVPETPAAGDIAYAGTFVSRGLALGIVVATGERTRLAGIARLTERPRSAPTPLARELSRLVRVIAIAALGTGAVFFLVALLAGLPLVDAFIFTLGVTVALVPEGLLPTITLSLAIAAQRMAQRNALVRHLEAVETLGLTTVICTDKTGTLTRNELSAVLVWTPVGAARIEGEGYAPSGRVTFDPGAEEAVRRLVRAAVICAEGRAVQRDGRWEAEGDPLDAAVWALARRLGLDPESIQAQSPPRQLHPFDPHRRRMSVIVDRTAIVKGAPEAMLSRCHDTGQAAEIAERLAREGLRVIAVAERTLAPHEVESISDPEEVEHELELLGFIGFFDLPRPEAAEALARCRDAGIRVIMVTGDHPATALVVARQVGLVRERPFVLTEAELPDDDAVLGALIDRDEVVLARIRPETKLRIARVLRRRGHVVAMTGDGVNDAPALHEADVGVAMGRTGTDVAREAADLVLLDDNFATIVAAIEQGRATYHNIRRFLTYHLTDNVAELAPFVVWALSGGALPLALGVLQILLLDLGTDALPALALGVEPPAPEMLRTPPPRQHLVDARVLQRAFLTLGPAEALVELAAFFGILAAFGWRPGGPLPSQDILPAASGTAFAAVVFGQAANALANRSDTRPVWRVGFRGNPAIGSALLGSFLLLFATLFVPPLARVVHQAPPPPLGWALAFSAVPVVVLVDAVWKAWRSSGKDDAHGQAIWSTAAPRTRPARKSSSARFASSRR
ncbi:MAG: cation-transporting P-type ATPase [Thermomicrobium sp.]|nr:cation-transporting P-type ATPase [Thermomicrobium sp.]